MTILWAGGEDADFLNNGGCTVVTTAGHFRSGYARCSIRCPNQASTAAPITSYWRTLNGFSSSNFWWSARTYSNGIGAAAGAIANFFLMRFLDATNVVRLRITTTSATTGSIAALWKVQKVDASGTLTDLVTFTTSFTDTTLQKFDIHVNYAVAGSIDVYIDGILVATYSGDVTTNSITALTGFDLGQSVCSGAPGLGMEWSEVIVADVDTRSMALITEAPSGAGALSQFTGTASGSTSSEITLSDADGIDTGTANNVSLFTQAGTLPASIDYSILAVVVSARALTVAAQPQHLDLAVRFSATVYLSADKNLTTAFAPYQNVWDTNPNTSVAWTAADLTTTQIGVKAIA